jgi:hypothetical protein
MGGDRSAIWVNKAGHSFVTTDVLKRKFATSDWAKSDADENDNEVDGVVAGTTTDYFMLVTNGYIKRMSGSWSANLQYYLDTTAGALTGTKPTSGYIRPVLRTISTTEALVQVGDLEYHSPAPATPDTIAAGGTISALDPRTYPGLTSQWHAVIGSATGQNAMSTTPFGGSAPAVPVEIWLVGTDNDKTVTLATNDANYGAWVAGGFIELSKGTVVGFRWIPERTRWCEISRNNYSM